MTLYNIVASSAQATVVAEYKPLPYDAKDYQSEAQLEQELLRNLSSGLRDHHHSERDRSDWQPAPAAGSAEQDDLQ